MSTSSVQVMQVALNGVQTRPIKASFLLSIHKYRQTPFCTTSHQRMQQQIQNLHQLSLPKRDSRQERYHLLEWAMPQNTATAANHIDACKARLPKRYPTSTLAPRVHNHQNLNLRSAPTNVNRSGTNATRNPSSDQRTTKSHLCQTLINSWSAAITTTSSGCGNKKPPYDTDPYRDQEPMQQQIHHWIRAPPNRIYAKHW